MKVGGEKLLEDGEVLTRIRDLLADFSAEGDVRGILVKGTTPSLIEDSTAAEATVLDESG